MYRFLLKEVYKQIFAAQVNNDRNFKVGEMSLVTGVAIVIFEFVMGCFSLKRQWHAAYWESSEDWIENNVVLL